MMDDNISLLKTIEKTYTNNELIEILVYKKNEIDKFINNLPFKLTDSQCHAVHLICSSLHKEFASRRLI